MSNILCISRSYGSGGHEIGKMAADALGIPCYDKVLLDEGIKRSGLPAEMMEKVEERIANPYLYALNYDSPHAEFRGKTTNDILFAAEKAVIENLARQGNCVIVGRCAAEILQKEHTVLSVFIDADTDARLQCVMHRDNLTEKKALERLRKVDKYRTDFHRYYVGSAWGTPESYDACFSTSRRSAAWITEAICTLYVQNGRSVEK